MRLARDTPASRRIMPRLIRYDENRHTIVLELLPDAESLLALSWPPQRLSGRDRTNVGRRDSASITPRPARCVENEKLKPLLLRQTPVILTLGRGGHDILSRFGRIGPMISAVLQQHKDFEGLLDALGAEWRFDSLIHGDMKWDNVLVFPGEQRARLSHR